MFDRTSRGVSTVGSPPELEPEVSKRSCATSDALCGDKQCEACTKKIKEAAWKYVVYNATYDLLLKHADIITLSYSVADGLNLPYTFLKSILEVIHCSSQSQVTDLLREFLDTPEGVVIAVITSVFFLALSLAVYFTDDRKDKDKNKDSNDNPDEESLGIKKDGKNSKNCKNETDDSKKSKLTKAQKDLLDMLWRCVRGIVKSFKNAFKGFRTLIQLAILFGSDVGFLLLPFGLIICATAIANRLWTLRMQDQRKKMKKNNEFYLAELLAQLDGAKPLGIIKDEDGKILEIEDQTKFIKVVALLSAAYCGAVNGPYLYLGFLVALSALVSWPVFVAMVSLCCIYSALHITTSLVEEKEYQRDQAITTVKAELASAGLALKRALEAQDIVANNAQRDKVKDKLKAFEQKRDQLQKLISLSSMDAVMYGLFNGMAVYRAIAGLASIALLVSSALPPAFLVVCMTIGVVCLVTFAIHAYLHYKEHRVQQEKEKASFGFLEELPANAQKKAEKIASLNKIIHGEIEKNAELLYVKDVAEGCRLVTSGFTKGEKLVTNFLGIGGTLGLVLGVISSIIQALILPFRYFVKLVTSNPSLKKKKEEGVSPALSQVDASKTEQPIGPLVKAKHSADTSVDGSFLSLSSRKPSPSPSPSTSLKSTPDTSYSSATESPKSTTSGFSFKSATSQVKTLFSSPPRPIRTTSDEQPATEMVETPLSKQSGRVQLGMTPRSSINNMIVAF